MKLSVSNLAWPIEETKWCLDQLLKHNIEGVEIAPLKVFDSWDSIQDDRIQKVKLQYSSLGLQISSFQAITFGVDDLALLGDKAKVDNFLKHMENVAYLLNQLDGQNAVFGSPGLRKSTEYNEQELISLFTKINTIFVNHNVNFVLETVPFYYGCNLLNTLKKTDELLSKLKLSNVCRHFDSACQFLSGDLDNQASYKKFIAESKHLHISEVDLISFKEPSVFNIDLVPIIKTHYQGDWCVLEMGEKNYSRSGFLKSISNFSILFKN